MDLIAKLPAIAAAIYRCGRLAGAGTRGRAVGRGPKWAGSAPGRPGKRLLRDTACRAGCGADRAQLPFHPRHIAATHTRPGA